MTSATASVTPSAASAMPPMSSPFAHRIMPSFMGRRKLMRWYDEGAMSSAMAAALAKRAPA